MAGYPTDGVMALICGTLLSSQGSGAHQELPFRAVFGATFLTYRFLSPRSNPTNRRVFPKEISKLPAGPANLAPSDLERSRRLGVRSSLAGPQEYVLTWSKSKSVTCEADHLAAMVITGTDGQVFPDLKTFFFSQVRAVLRGFRRYFVFLGEATATLPRVTPPCLVDRQGHRYAHY